METKQDVFNEVVAAWLRDELDSIEDYHNSGEAKELALRNAQGAVDSWRQRYQEAN